jgi:hypothetical protein
LEIGLLKTKIHSAVAVKLSSYIILVLFYLLFADIKKEKILRRRSINIRQYLQVVQRQREASDQREPNIRQYFQVVQRQREASDQREPNIRQYFQVVQRQREASYQREPNIRQEDD